MGVSSTWIGFLILLSKDSKVPIYYSPVAWNQTQWPPLFILFFNVLGVISNCAKVSTSSHYNFFFDGITLSLPGAVPARLEYQIWFNCNQNKAGSVNI